MAIIYVFCGLPGSGKSTKAEDIKREYGEYGNGVEIISTDAIREEVFGDINTQEHNAEVFDIAYKRLKEFAETKDCVIFDATNTTIKSRRRIFNCGIDREKHEIVCVVFNTPFRECVERDSRRSKCVGQAVIEKFYKSFQIPFEEEGWDHIIIWGNPQHCGHNIRKEMEGFDQKCKWHSLPLKEHCDKVKDLMVINGVKSSILFDAALLHDYGKLFTQTFDEDGEAHYYNHENIGTYELMSRGFHNLDVLFYVNYHMRPFNWGRGSSKGMLKAANLFGPEKVHNLIIFNMCDTKAQK